MSTGDDALDADHRADGRRSRRPHTVLVTAGRTSGAGRPLSVPLVLASAFRAAAGPTPSATPGRKYARDDGSPTWEALEEVIGDLEGGSAVASSSGTAAAAAAFDLVPAGAAVVIPTDRHAGVQHLVADGEQLGRRSAVRVDVTDTEAGQEHIPPGLLHLSVGCEHLDDLWDDLLVALAGSASPTADAGDRRPDLDASA